MLRKRPALLLLVVGCATAACATSQKEPAASKTAEAEAERLLTFESGGRPLPDDPLWARASQFDPLDLRALGRREGATQLIGIVEAGGATGAIALAALAVAPDARAERARACELLADVKKPERPIVLAAVHRLLAEAPELHEALAPGGDETCSAQLTALMADTELRPNEHDLAESARARLDREKSSDSR